MNYKQTLKFLYARLPVFHLTGGSAYKPGLTNTIALLEALGNPHQLFKQVHVAGTNGKGSVSHMLSAIFQSSGYKTGLYTSPHLVDFGERIRINGQMIDPDFVVQFVKNNYTLIERVQPSFFELAMAMAFKYFEESGVDIAIIETGLGGRLDSTNIITPEISVITTIGLDHTEFLGDTIHQIAVEKAGIIKNAIPVVIGESQHETRSIFESKAAETHTKIIFADEQYKLQHITTDNQYLWFGYKEDKYACELTGQYQLKNITTVLATIEVLREKNYTISEFSVKDGLRRVCKLTGLRGRWEKLAEDPLIIADTGHNVQGITEVVKQLETFTTGKIHIILGMVNDKDISGVLHLLPEKASYYFTNAQVKRAMPSSDLQLLASTFGLKGSNFNIAKHALQAAQQQAAPNDLILITGSNFLVGELLDLI